MFSLHNRVLLWSINTTMLMHNAIRSKKKKIGMLNSKALSILICLILLNFDIELSKNHGMERNNKRPHIRFRFH